MGVEPKNNYVNNTLWGLLEKSSRIISGILVGVLVVRFLGKEQYGVIAYGLRIVAILTIFSALGLDSLVVRELITRKGNKDTILGTAFWLRFCGSFVVMAGSVLYASIRDDAHTTWIVFLLSISIVFQSLSVIDFYFQSAVKGRYTAINQVITLFISALIKLYLIYVKAPLEWFASMAAFEAAMIALNQWIFYKKDGQFIRQWRFSSIEAKHLLILSLPVICSSFLQMLYQKADGILIERFLHNFGLVGNYDAGVRISEAAYVIPVALCAAVFPGIINNRHNKPLQLKRLTQLYSIMIWSAVTIVIGGTLFGDWAINLLYGSKFELAPQVFKIFIWVNIPVFWGTAWGMWMLAENKQKYVVWMQILNGIIILVSEFILIPLKGINGAAYAMILGSYTAFIFMVFAYKPKQGLQIFISALNPKNIIEVFKYSKNK
ncbi:MAG: flippase [Bacteroidia bacterium]|nr:flippase [Bacteroidia bacterium]